jgi:hypothetical protein
MESDYVFQVGVNGRGAVQLISEVNTTTPPPPIVVQGLVR